MRNVVFGFSTPKKFNLLSWVIRKCEKVEFSHVYLKVYNTYFERWMIYQASGSKVNFIGFDRFLEHHNVVKEIELEISEENYKLMYQEAIDTLGVSYGVKQLIGMGLVRLFNLFNIRISNPFADGKATYVCSEAIATILSEYFGFKVEDLDNISPKDIYERFLLMEK